VPPDELLDVIEPDGTWVGRRTRRQVHAEGLWHQVFHCLIVRSAEPARVVLQQRHRHLRSFGGKLDLSATGHLSAGEDPLDGIREVAEELGIDIDPARLVPLGARLLVDDSGEGRNRERVHAYLLADDRPLVDFAPDPGAVEALVEVEVADLLAIVGDPGTVVRGTRWAPGSDPVEVRVAAADLVPAVDGYWVVLAVMADRFARGLRPVAI
jgi:8-oxo-dGTP pyrophosphatase MutT (NUDIX family)